MTLPPGTHTTIDSDRLEVICRALLNTKDARGADIVDAARLDRAVDIFGRKDYEQLKDGKGNLTDRWSVLSDTGKGSYVVTGTTCTCPDSARGNWCKHAITVYLARLVPPLPTRPPACRECGTAAARIGMVGLCTRCANKELFGEVVA